jgi:hypothetical protein
MKTLLHFRETHDSYFHPHPLHTVFSLVISFVLALLAVLILTVSAK